VVGADGLLPLPWIATWLSSAQRLTTHAVLLHGPQGIGQWPLATTLAQGWLCESESGPRPCGQCASCRLVQARSHPDLLVLLPEALQESLGWSAGGDEDGGVAEKGGKSRQPSKDIKVDAVRAAVEFAQTSAGRGRGKVMVIHPAERMNGVAANALLKTLEEPPGDTRFVLSCAAPHVLLPTIRSRCQSVALALPDAALATAWLAQQGIDRPEVVLAAAGGQPFEAQAWAQEGLGAHAWLQLPMRVARNEAVAVAGWPLPRVVDALQKLAHDMMAVAVDAPVRYFPRDALPPAVRLPPLLDWSAELARVARHAEHPWNAGLASEALVAQGAKALSGADNARTAPAGRSVNSRP
jgi:DNA polymerase-3 subunit delta'